MRPRWWNAARVRRVFAKPIRIVLAARVVIFPAALVVIVLLGGPRSASAGLAERLAVQRLSDALPTSARIATDPLTDAVQVIGGLDEPLPGSGSEVALLVRSWMWAHAAAFGLDTTACDLVVERDEPRARGGRRILLRQTWHGRPVEGGDARAVVSAAGRLRAVSAGFAVALALPDTPRLARTEAVRLAVRDVDVPLERTFAEAALWVRRTPAGDGLAWRVRLGRGDGPGLARWVDALTGATTDADEICARAVGLVYPTDPRQPLAEVPLLRLLAGPGLQSATIHVEDQLDPLVSPIGPDDDYRLLDTDPGFDQVNAYWHADHYLHDALGSLGYPGPPEPLIVRVGAPLEPNVAVTSGRFVLFGRPIANFCRDPARACDIVYHELTHAVLYGAGVLPGGARREAGALHEGLADYMAAALTGDPAIGEWLYLTFPSGVTRVDQPVDPWNASHYDAVSFAGAPLGSVWANGMILAGAVWDLRAGLGRSCDSLVVEAIDYLPTLPTWTQFASAMIQADEDHHAGAFRAAIITALGARGFRGNVLARITGPTTLAPGDTGVFVAEPCCDGAEGTYHWSARNWCRGAPCGDWRPLGEGRVLEVAFQDDTELQLEAISAWGDPITTSRFVGVRPPTLIVQGPRRVVQHGTATWTARAAAMGPMRLQWQRRWRGNGPIYEYLGEGLETSFAADTSCDIAVTLLDGLLRMTKVDLIVETFADVPPPEAPAALRVSQRPDAHARAMETTIQLPRNGQLRIRVYDVRGRERARLWDGPATRGTHIVRWDAGGLEPGVYLMRVEGEPTGTVFRFTIVR